ncbi:hypothetical protein HDV04_006205 [Boothiomyces sp. JEL0838]|nr:hypothetical protein HDV04_006205 [Boothiomyces sp. JEL0838]
MLILKALNFFGAAAAANTYLYTSYFYFQYFQLSKDQVGTITSITPLVSLVAIPCVMYLGDTIKWLTMKRLLLICNILGTIFWSLHLFVPQFSPIRIYLIIAIVVASAVSLSSCGTIQDALTISVLGKDKDKYGQQRLYASVSWGLSSLLTGYLIDITNNYWIPIYLFIVFSIIQISIICCLHVEGEAEDISDQLPTVTEGQDEEQSIGNADESVNASDDTANADETQPLIGTTPTLYSSIFKPKTVLFFTTISLLGFVFAIIGAYLFIYLSLVWKASPTLLGLTTPFSVLMELPVFYYSGGNYLILLIEITHGASFAFQWAAGIELTQQLAHPKYVQTFIGIFCSLSNNAGGIIGNTIGGFVYEFYGYYYMWGICLIVLIVSFVLFSISLKIRK